jgi:predicted HicB family RNase H-like nuclease
MADISIAAMARTQGGRKAPGQKDYVRLNVRMTPEVFREVSILAAADRRDISPWISVQLEKMVAAEKAKTR